MREHIGLSIIPRFISRFVFGISLQLMSTVAAPSAYGYVGTLTQVGTQVRWSGTPRLNLVGNSANRSGISSRYFFNAVTTALQRWKAAAQNFIQFDYWQGSDSANYEPNSEYNGHSSIYFLSNANVGTDVDSNVLGLTQVWYEPDNGQILETDILLNDRDHFLSTAPTSTYFIDSIITHELGHAFGLSHSGGLQDTMLYVASLEQNHLGCSEWGGIRSIYGVGVGETGSVSGRILSPGGTPVFGVEVVAISKLRGVSLGSAMTDASGSYILKSIEPGDYYLMAQPYYAGASGLSDYYANANSVICSGRNFSRTFYEDGAGPSLHSFSVRAGSTTSAGTLNVQCSGTGGAAVTALGGSTLTQAPVISSSAGFGLVDRMSGSTKYYALTSVSGHLDIHTLSYSLYSPVQVQMHLLDSVGNEISTTIQNPIYRGQSGFTDFDAELDAGSLGMGTYYLAVTSTSIPSALYSAPQSLDTVPFVVITGSVNAAEPPLASELPDHPRCQQTESFAAYASPAGGPPRNNTQESDSSSVGFCGSIRNISGGGPPSGPTPGDLAGWFLPWVLMALVVQGRKLWIRGQRIELRFGSDAFNLGI